MTLRSRAGPLSGGSRWTGTSKSRLVAFAPSSALYTTKVLGTSSRLSATSAAEGAGAGAVTGVQATVSAAATGARRPVIRAGIRFRIHDSMRSTMTPGAATLTSGGRPGP